MSRGPQAVALDLSEAERARLQRLLRRHGTAQALAQRVRIIRACAQAGATNLGVARALGVSRQTVTLWRARFARHRLEGLVDAPRSGAPRSIDDEAIRRLIALPWKRRRPTPRSGAPARRCLDPRFLVDAQYDGAMRRSQVDPA